MSTKTYENKAAPGVPFFTPAQEPPAGTALNPQPDGKPIPKLFTPIKIRDLELQNRVWLSPLCQYSSINGHAQPDGWHLAHLGGIISRGPGLSIIEAAAISPEGRITPHDVGIWEDSQIEPLKRLTAFAHGQNQKIAIQIAHAGRKASAVAPWLHANAIATKEQGGWPDAVIAPSPIPFEPGVNPVPNELTLDGIKTIVAQSAAAARRAVKAGFDVIEIHNAHGYLLMSFLSPISNKRTDAYGGSFENRVRLTLEVVDAVRAAIPEGMPLFLRISASDRVEAKKDEYPESWTNEDTIRLAGLLAERGVDLLDVSSGGVALKQDLSEQGAQQRFAKEVKAALGDKILVGTVGGIVNGKQAEDILHDTGADVALVGKHFQKNPGAVWQFAEDLGTQIYVAHQIEWGFFGRGTSRRDLSSK
ncbi:NADH:flavin oxidoreductase 1 [Schizophyllum commune H4-8]|nr:NADH:flavin oxidoreductase 1 [Schizophyllum commune H4-8]KAI5898416.1 NADH:flavin oxidoreductase 1 [Schizophyllum commune H4-8]